MWYRIKNCHMLALLIPGCRPCGHKAKQTWTDAVRNMKYSGIKVVSMPIHSPVVVESKNQTTLSSGTIPWPALYQSAVWRQCKAPEMFKLGAAAGNTLTMSTPHNSTSSDPFSSFKRRYRESGNRVKEGKLGQKFLTRRHWPEFYVLLCIQSKSTIARDVCVGSELHRSSFRLVQVTYHVHIRLCGVWYVRHTQDVSIHCRRMTWWFILLNNTSLKLLCSFWLYNLTAQFVRIVTHSYSRWCCMAASKSQICTAEGLAEDLRWF